MISTEYLEFCACLYLQHHHQAVAVNIIWCCLRCRTENAIVNSSVNICQPFHTEEKQFCPFRTSQILGQDKTMYKNV